MSSRSFATLIPIKQVSIFTRPCICGLALRPGRLFGFDGITDGAPSSVTAFFGRDTIGLPSVPAEPILRRLRAIDIQGTEDTEVACRMTRPAPPAQLNAALRGAKLL